MVVSGGGVLLYGVVDGIVARSLQHRRRRMQNQTRQVNNKPSILARTSLK